LTFAAVASIQVSAALSRFLSRRDRVMTKRTHMGIVLLAIATGLAGCNRTDAPQPTLGPSPVPGAAPVPTPTAPQLISFADIATGFITSDVRDAQNHVVQFNSNGDLIWTADGTHLNGYRVAGALYVAAETLCQCWLEIRFGTEDGERRAYLTADYGHSNPGTLINLDVASGSLVMTQSDRYPPGSYTLSGVITELTSTGLVPIEGVEVWRLYGSGWQEGTTDRNGFYKIQGLYDRTDTVSAGKQGYQSFEERVAVHGDTRLDIQLARR
jgi:hypothetical protein